MIPINETLDKLERATKQLIKLINEINIDPVDSLQLESMEHELRRIRIKAIQITEEVNQRMIQHNIDRRIHREDRRKSA